MKKIFTTCILLAFFSCFMSGAFAQNVIAVEHSGVSSFYQNLDTAMAHAVSGDMVYLPATSYNFTNFIINKGVHFVGAGSNLDSSSATGITVFNGTVFITSGADNGSIEGIYFNGNIHFGMSSSDQTINMYSINRCVMNALHLSYNGSTGTASTNINIIENIIKGYILCGYAQNIVISKNIVESYVGYISGSALIENNVFLYPACPAYMFTTVSAATIRNNIFFASPCTNYETYQFFGGGTSGNMLSHNMFTKPFTIQAGNPLDDNIFNVGDTLFINQSGNIYDIHHNYHLRSTCLGKNAGTDGTDIGLYGTASPKKDGEIPYNPHIQAKAIPSSTNAQGNLNINIKVKAQDN